jgi:hypothetical protein
MVYYIDGLVESLTAEAMLIIKHARMKCADLSRDRQIQSSNGAT